MDRFGYQKLENQQILSPTDIAFKIGHLKDPDTQLFTKSSLLP